MTITQKKHDAHAPTVGFDEMSPAEGRQLLTGLSMVATQTGVQGPGSYHALLEKLARQARERYANLNLDG